MINRVDRGRLIALARTALTAGVHGVPLPDPPVDFDIDASGIFVTIRCGGLLRGCLGTLDPPWPRTLAVIRLAAEVASRDYRFEPVRLHELADVALDLSLLTIPRPLEDARDLVIGRDGLIVEHRGRRGLLLPQVATEHGWDRETFLAHACIKAGLARDAWRDGARLFCFEAEVIGDNETREMP